MFAYLKALGKMVFGKEEQCFSCPIDCDHEEVVTRAAQIKRSKKPFRERILTWHPEFRAARHRWILARQREGAGLPPIDQDGIDKASEAFVTALCCYADGKPTVANAFLKESCIAAGTLVLH